MTLDVDLARDVLTKADMQAAQHPDGHNQARPFYPVRPISIQEAHGELLYAFGRLFARGPDSRWHLVEMDDGGTDD